MGSRTLPLVACMLALSCARSLSTPGGADLAGSVGGDLAVPDAAADFSAASGPDLFSFDGPPGMAYDDLGKSDSGICPAGQTGASCANPIAAGAGCGAVEICGNGLDDNCNGKVDEGCNCRPGDVQKCFLGPPGKHGVGQCADGQQTCFGSEFGTWSDCQGSIGPTPEICDKLDNDCNGCIDDGLCCDALLNCPGPGDPRIVDAQPYTDVMLQGGLFFTGAAASWSWSVTGGPCDQLFAGTTGTPPTQSFTVTSGNMQNATVHFTLSGDYTVTLTVVGTDGKTYSCTWIQHVVGPGVRFELCWDHTGFASQGGADLDLHVHRSATTTNWFGTRALFGVNANPDDCYYMNCKASEYSGGLQPQPSWGYSNSNLMQCIGSPDGPTWQSTLNACHNPRLDIDNVATVGRPENTNIDNPGVGDSFRALVHYYGQDGSRSQNTVEEHPIVNIYCNGKLKATYGASPNTLGPCPGATCFNTGSAWGAGLMWRVADVKATVDAMGNPDCAVTPIHPPMATSGYYVTNGSIAY